MRYKRDMITPRPIPALENLASEAAPHITRLLEKAYTIGRDDMRRELMALLSPSRGSDGIAMTGTVSDANVIVARTSTKAPPGTVKPAILHMIENSPPLLTEQIISQTGFKENSVRGTLSALYKGGKIERTSGGLWTKKHKVPSAETEETS